MDALCLVVSDPPHGEVDVATTAAVLGLDLPDAELKIDFKAPEVLAAGDAGHALEQVASLRAAGMSVAVLEGRALADVPWPKPVVSFELRDSALTVNLRNSEVVLPFDISVVGVYCRPPKGFPPGGPDAVSVPSMTTLRGADVSRALEWMSALDVYVPAGDSVQRLSFARDVTDFSGLEDAQGTSAEEKLAALVMACRQSFTRIELDTRLVGVRPRQRFVPGDAGFDLDLRKAYSFGTLLLRSVLDSISPDLRDLTQYELGSRLAYVMREARIA